MSHQFLQNPKIDSAFREALKEEVLSQYEASLHPSFLSQWKFFLSGGLSFALLAVFIGSYMFVKTPATNNLKMVAVNSTPTVETNSDAVNITSTPSVENTAVIAQAQNDPYELSSLDAELTTMQNDLMNDSDLNDVINSIDL